MGDIHNQPIKLYSQKSITFGTFLGGPLAAGILARQNYLQLGKEKEGMYALIIGIILTFLIIVAIVATPGYIIDKIPRELIPFVYTGIISLIIERLQGKELKAHKENNGEFYSGWKVAGIGAMSMVILFVGAFGCLFLSQGNFDAKKYDDQIALTRKNENQALALFKIIDTASPKRSVEFIDQIGIPAWKSNLVLLDQLDQMKGLVEPLIKQNKVLRNYWNLRIESYQLIKRALFDQPHAHEKEIQDFNQRMVKELDKLKE